MRYISSFRFVAPLLAMTWASSAFAESDMQQCAAAYEGAQTSQKDGKYAAALEQAKACAQPACGILVNECLRMYDDLQRDVPTFVFSAQNADGDELVDVDVTVDGKPVLQKLDGTSLPLDPGEHKIRFETKGQPPVEVTHIARLGDHHRLISVTIGEKKAEPAAPPPVTSSSASVVVEEPKGVPVATWALGGLGVLSLGATAYLRISGISDYNKLNQDCSPYCNPNEVDDIKTKFTASYITAGVAGAAFAGAAVFYFVGRGGSKEQAVQAAVMPLPGGASAHIFKRF